AEGPVSARVVGGQHVRGYGLYLLVPLGRRRRSVNTLAPTSRQRHGQQHPDRRQHDLAAHHPLLLQSTSSPVCDHWLDEREGRMTRTEGTIWPAGFRFLYRELSDGGRRRSRRAARTDS